MFKTPGGQRPLFTVSHSLIVKRHAAGVRLPGSQCAEDRRVLQFRKRIDLLLKKIGIGVIIIEKAIRQRIMLNSLQRHMRLAQAIIDTVDIAQRAAAQQRKNLVTPEVLSLQGLLRYLLRGRTKSGLSSRSMTGTPHLGCRP